MTDPGVRQEKGFFRRIWDSITGGDRNQHEELEKRDRKMTEASQAKTVTAKEAGYLCGERSPLGPEGRRTYYKQLLTGQIKVVRRDGTFWGERAR